MRDPRTVLWQQSQGFQLSPVRRRPKPDQSWAKWIPLLGSWGLIVTNVWFWSFSDFCSKLSLWNPYSSCFIPLFPEFLRQERISRAVSLKRILASKGKESTFPFSIPGYLSPKKAQEGGLSAEQNHSASRLRSYELVKRWMCSGYASASKWSKGPEKIWSTNYIQLKKQGQGGDLKVLYSLKKSIHSSTASTELSASGACVPVRWHQEMQRVRK